MLHVVTIRWGDKYSVEYSDKLRNMVSRHLSVPHTFDCYTDRVQTSYDLELPVTSLEGWWNKLCVFGFVHRPVLWLDLDTVITGNIDFVADASHLLIMLRDAYHHEHYQSSVMLIQGVYDLMWFDFACDRTNIVQRFHGDQEYIEYWLRRHNITPGLWQELLPGYFRSYKVDCQNGLPPDARIVFFHGNPRPHEADAGWIEEHWR